MLAALGLGFPGFAVAVAVEQDALVSGKLIADQLQQGTGQIVGLLQHIGKLPRL